MANLGEQLKEIRAAKLAAEQAAEQARAQAAYDKSQAERKAIQYFWHEYLVHIHKAIANGKEPTPLRTPMVFFRGNPHITQSNHPHHDLWLDMRNEAAQLGLNLFLNFQGDNWGTDRYAELTVEPI